MYVCLYIYIEIHIRTYTQGFRTNQSIPNGTTEWEGMGWDTNMRMGSYYEISLNFISGFDEWVV